MRVDIRPYTPQDWESLSDFIRQHWAADHPMTRRDLFEWQYRGFSEGPGVLLLHDRQRLLGFLGLIQAEYQVNRPRADRVRGCALAMWMVHPEFRQAGLGLALLREAESQASVVVCLGANAEAGRYYGRRGYRCCPALSRWVGPLHAAGYVSLCTRPSDRGMIAHWAEGLMRRAPLARVAFAADELARFWLAASRRDDRWTIQGIHRSERFWQTRYLDSVGFRYMFWGERSAGVVVARVEPVFDTPHSVLRLIELLPGRPAAWDSEADESLAELLSGVLAWAAREGCVAVDYQCAGDLLAPTLRLVGLRRQGLPPDADAATSLAPVFQPLRFAKPPINVYWRCPDGVDDTPWYFPKSDGDMDRPHAVR